MKYQQMYYTKQVISFESVHINVIQIRFAFVSSHLFTVFRNSLISNPTLARLCLIAHRSMHSDNTCCTYAWDTAAVTKTNDSFEILAYWASFKCQCGGCLVQQVETKIVLLAGHPN